MEVPTPGTLAGTLATLQHQGATIIVLQQPAEDTATGPVLTLAAAGDAFLESLGAKSPETQKTYAVALRRYFEHLAASGIPPSTATTALRADALEHFYTWLLKT